MSTTNHQITLPYILRKLKQINHAKQQSEKQKQNQYYENNSISQNFSSMHTLYKQQIRTQLQKYQQFTSQQLIKLSAYYETKLQYQANSYEQQVSELKQEIQRQYKVIGLMKQQLEELVILVNQRANMGSNNHRESSSARGGENYERDQYAYEKQKERQNAEWRIKKLSNDYENQICRNQDNLSNSNNPNSQLDRQSSQSLKKPQSSSQIYYPQTISGLQIIAEQQTQRTLMSVGQEQQNNQFRDYQEDDYVEEQMEGNQNIQGQEGYKKMDSNDFMRIEDDKQEQQNQEKGQEAGNKGFENQKEKSNQTNLNDQEKKENIYFQQERQVQQHKDQNHSFNRLNFQCLFPQNSQEQLVGIKNSQRKSNDIQKAKTKQLQISQSTQKSHKNSIQAFNDKKQTSFKYQYQQFLQPKNIQKFNSSHTLRQSPHFRESRVSNKSNKSNKSIKSNKSQQNKSRKSSQKCKQNKKASQKANQQNNNLHKKGNSSKTNFVPNPFGKKKTSKVIYKQQQYLNFDNYQPSCEQSQSQSPSLYHHQFQSYQNKQTQQNQTRNKIYYNQNNQANSSHNNEKLNNSKLQRQNQEAQKSKQLNKKSKMFLKQFKKSFIETYENNSRVIKLNSLNGLNLLNPDNYEGDCVQVQQDNSNNNGGNKKQKNVMSILEMIALRNYQYENQKNRNKNKKNSTKGNNNKSQKIYKPANNKQNKYPPADTIKSTSSRSVSKGKNSRSFVDANNQNYKHQKGYTNNNSSYKLDKRYYHHTEEREPQSEEENDAVRMIRMSTDQNYRKMNQQYEESEENRDCLTSSFQEREIYSESHSRQNYFPSETHSNDNTCREYKKELKSLHTTFGRPSNNSEWFKESGGYNNQKNTRLNIEQNLIQITRKNSQKLPLNSHSSKTSHYGKQNKQNYLKNNKANRKHSYNYSSSGVLLPLKEDQNIPNNKQSINMKKKPHNQKIYEQGKKYFSSNQQSIHHMLQNHLQSANKFLVGCKKQQLKYDGQKVTITSNTPGNNVQSLGTLRHGHGTLYYSNGLIYDGQFVQNKRQGFGLLKFNHVELYAGQWLNDELHGQGKIRNCAIINKKKKQLSQNSSNSNTQNGSGQSLNNPFLKWISYCGQFKHNRFEGQGTLYLQGGQKFVGRFKNGAVQGQGSWFRKNGQVEVGTWKNNVLIQRLQTQWN